MPRLLRRLLFVLLSIVCVLLLMYWLADSLSGAIHSRFGVNLSWPMSDRFNLDGEANIPTWYSTILLYSVALCAFVVYLSHLKSPRANRGGRLFWIGFALFYCFLSADEAARLHEVVDGYRGVNWVCFYAPLVATFFLMCVWYLAVMGKGDKLARKWMLGGLILYAGGGMFCELISFWLHPLPPVWQRLEVTVEEGLELGGTIMVLMGCLLELGRVYGFAGGRAEPGS